MATKRDFPIFNTKKVNCSHCKGELVVINDTEKICPICSKDMIEQLRLALRVAKLGRREWKDGSAFDKIVDRLIQGKFSVEYKDI